MDTNRLRQFCAIVELGSLIKASQLLHITPAGLSKSMKFLQEEVSLRLFRPSGSGITITDHGFIFYKQAKELLEQESRLFQIKKNSQQISIKIAMPFIFQFCMGAPLKKNLFTSESVSLLELDPHTVEKSIANRQIDFGVTFIPFPNEEVEIIEVGKFSSSCYHLKNTFEKKEFSEIPFATPSRDLQHNYLEIRERDGWQGNIPRYNKFSITHLSSAIELVLQGLCAVYMPDFIAHKINASRKPRESLVEYSLPNAQKNTLSAFIIRHKDDVENTAFKQLHQIIKEIISLK